MFHTQEKTILVVSLELFIAALMMIGANLANPTLKNLYHSYFADVVLPAGLYFLLTTKHMPGWILRHWWIRALPVFGLCATSESLQYFGIFALARVFDPIEYVMYGTGVMLATFLDRQVFSRLLKFWDCATLD